MDPVKTVFLFIVGIVHLSLALKACPGCTLEKDINDPSVHMYLVKTLSQLRTAPTGTENEPVTLIKITKATYQVVGGILNNYEFEANGLKTHQLYLCQMRIFNRVWTGEQKIEEFGCKPVSSKNRMLSFLAGREKIINTNENSDSLTELKKLINEKLNEHFNSENYVGVFKFYKASSQVVAGTLYRARVEVAETDCRADSYNKENCHFKIKDHKACEVEIWEKSWLNQNILLKLECREIPRFCAGCPIEKDKKDEKAIKCLKRALFNHNNKPETTNQLGVSSINRIQSQVVNGVKYIYDFVGENSNGEKFACRAEILSQTWISDEPILEVFRCSQFSH